MHQSPLLNSCLRLESLLYMSRHSNYVLDSTEALRTDNHAQEIPVLEVAPLSVMEDYLKRLIVTMFTYSSWARFTGTFH